MRHLGQERQVTPEQAMLDKRILRQLFRAGGSQLEGTLAGRCASKVNSSTWRESIGRLSDWGFVATQQAARGNARVVSATPHGEGWGEELSWEVNREVLAASRAE